MTRREQLLKDLRGITGLPWKERIVGYRPRIMVEVKDMSYFAYSQEEGFRVNYTGVLLDEDGYGDTAREAVEDLKKRLLCLQKEAAKALLSLEPPPKV